MRQRSSSQHELLLCHAWRWFCYGAHDSFLYCRQKSETPQTYRDPKCADRLSPGDSSPKRDCHLLADASVLLGHPSTTPPNRQIQIPVCCVALACWQLLSWTDVCPVGTFLTVPLSALNQPQRPHFGWKSLSVMQRALRHNTIHGFNWKTIKKCSLNDKLNTICIIICNAVYGAIVPTIKNPHILSWCRVYSWMRCLRSHYSVKLLTSLQFEQPCHVVRHNALGCGLGAERHDLSAAQHLPHNYPLSFSPSSLCE